MQKKYEYLHFKPDKESYAESQKIKQKLQNSYFDMYDSQKAIKHACRNLERIGVIYSSSENDTDELSRRFKAHDIDTAIEKIRTYEASKMMDQTINPKFDFIQFYKSDNNMEDGELRDTYVREPTNWSEKLMNKFAYKFFIGRRNKNNPDSNWRCLIICNLKYFPN